MENASKALIIAGAILLAILLISLGILIFNQAQDTVNNSGMSQAEITAFNNKFLKYEGKQKGSVVKSMINEVIASNSDASNANRKITVNNSDPAPSSGVSESSPSKFDSGKTYNVVLVYGSNGIVTNINVTQL